MTALTFLVSNAHIEDDRLIRFLPPRLRRAFTLLLAISLIAGTQLFAGDRAKPGRKLGFGQVYGTAVFLSSKSEVTTDAPNSVLSFTTKDGRRNLVLTSKAGDYLVLLEPGHHCVTAYTRKGEPTQLGDRQLKCVDVAVGKDTRFDVMLVRSQR